MYVEFEQLPETARIWIYVCDKPISGEDLEWLAKSTKAFLEKWTAHGNDLKSSFTFLHNHILIIGLDENAADASGCSIDASVHFIQGMGAHLKTDFFNRNLVPFFENGELRLVDLAELKSNLSEESISGDSTLFNTLVANKKNLGNAFIQLKESWLKTYLKIQDVTT